MREKYRTLDASSVLVRIHFTIWRIQAIYSLSAMRKEACHKIRNHKNIQNGEYSREIHGSHVYNMQCSLLAVQSYYTSSRVTSVGVSVVGPSNLQDDTTTAFLLLFVTLFLSLYFPLLLLPYTTIKRCIYYIAKHG